MLDAKVLAGQQAELRRLLAEPKVVKVPGFDDVIVRPFRFTQLASVAALAGPIIETLVIRPAMDAGAAGTTPDLTITDMELLFLQVIEQHPNELNGLLTLATGLTEAQIEQLGAMTGLDLCVALFEVNADFFAQALPMIAKIRMRQILGQFVSKGPSPSSAGSESTPTVSSEPGPEQPEPLLAPATDGLTS